MVHITCQVVAWLLPLLRGLESNMNQIDIFFSGDSLSPMETSDKKRTAEDAERRSTTPEPAKKKKKIDPVSSVKISKSF